MGQTKQAHGTSSQVSAMASPQFQSSQQSNAYVYTAKPHSSPEECFLMTSTPLLWPSLCSHLRTWRLYMQFWIRWLNAYCPTGSSWFVFEKSSPTCRPLIQHRRTSIANSLERTLLSMPKYLRAFTALAVGTNSRIHWSTFTTLSCTAAISKARGTTRCQIAVCTSSVAYWSSLKRTCACSLSSVRCCTRGWRNAWVRRAAR